jgi:predicted TIM-barrel fold metal-dependent hydrolase
VNALERERALIAEYDEELRGQLPAGSEIFDAHVHLGLDIDGFRGDYAELEEVQGTYGISRCFVFCLDEPDRHPAFRAANDRTLAFAARAGGRLVPFVRLDINEEPIEEATRCLDAGAEGIKLHPRAQRIQLHDERLVPVFELAADRKVPILIHGGRGLPPIAEHLSDLVERFAGTQLIIAHAGIADQAALFSHFAGRDGVYFDTSVWSPLDLLALFHHVSPEQIFYASDYPYGQQPGSLIIALRVARTAGLGDDHVRGMLGGNAARIADGAASPRLTAPRKEAIFSQPIAFARIHQYLSMAAPLLWTRQPDTVGVIGLALNACLERDGYQDERDRIRELLTVARALWDEMAAVADPDERRDGLPGRRAGGDRWRLSSASTAAATGSRRRSAARWRPCCATTSA